MTPYPNADGTLGAHTAQSPMMQGAFAGVSWSFWPNVPHAVASSQRLPAGILIPASCAPFTVTETTGITGTGASRSWFFQLDVVPTGTPPFGPTSFVCLSGPVAVVAPSAAGNEPTPGGGTLTFDFSPAVDALIGWHSNLTLAVPGDAFPPGTATGGCVVPSGAYYTNNCLAGQNAIGWLSGTTYTFRIGGGAAP